MKIPMPHFTQEEVEDSRKFSRRIRDKKTKMIVERGGVVTVDTEFETIIHEGNNWAVLDNYGRVDWYNQKPEERKIKFV